MPAHYGDKEFVKKNHRLCSANIKDIQVYPNWLQIGIKLSLFENS